MYVFDYLTKKETVKTIADCLERDLEYYGEFNEHHIFINENEIKLINNINIYVSVNCPAILRWEEDTNSSWFEFKRRDIEVTELYVEFDNEPFELTENETKILIKLIEKAL